MDDRSPLTGHASSVHLVEPRERCFRAANGTKGDDSTSVQDNRTFAQVSITSVIGFSSNRNSCNAGKPANNKTVSQEPIEHCDISNIRSLAKPVA